MWLRMGGAPSLVAVLTLYVVVFVVARLLHEPDVTTIRVALLVAFIVYCFARPHHGSDVFFIAAAPNASGIILHDLFGISQLLEGSLLLFVVLPALYGIDRGSGEADDASPSS